MKRYGNLFEKIYDLDNIRLAHKNARKGKTFYKEVQMVDADVENYVLKIHAMLMDKSFKNSKYVVFKRNFGGKEREIFKLPYFPDRIIHHCIMQVLEPIWKKTLIRNTFSSIKGRGIHDGVKRVKDSMKDINNTQYCLKMDVRKFYPSVDHDILKTIIRQKIKCENTLWLLDEIIDSTSGIPIGNYLSQYLGNVYLSGLDHYVKEVLRVKNYFRYCDDIVILHVSKVSLRGILSQINEYLQNILNVFMKNNYQIFPVDVRPVDFLGYRFGHGFTLVRKSISSRFKKEAMKLYSIVSPVKEWEIICSLMSYIGWLFHANSMSLMRKYLVIKKEVYQ